MRSVVTSLRCGSTLLSSSFQLRFITQNLWKFRIRLLIQSGIIGNNNRTRFYAVLLGVLLVFCEISDCTICEFCGADFVHLGKHVWHCKQRIQPVKHPTVDNPMRPLDTLTSLTNDQYNGNHAHLIINEERPLNVNSAEQSLNNQNNNGDCYMKECSCCKLCKGLRGLKAQSSILMISLPSSLTTSFLIIFLPKFPTRVLFTSVPARVMLKVNFVVPGMIT